MQALWLEMRLERQGHRGPSAAAIVTGHGVAHGNLKQKTKNFKNHPDNTCMLKKTNKNLKYREADEGNKNSFKRIPWRSSG